MTPFSEDICGYTFKDNRKYLVYANEGHSYFTISDSLQTLLCSRTTEVAQANEDLQYLTQLSQSIDQADFDRNGMVNFLDFLVFVKAFGSEESQFDINSSGKVDIADFIEFAKMFGQMSFSVSLDLVPLESE